MPINFSNPPKYIDVLCPGGCHRYKRFMMIMASGEPQFVYSGYCIDCNATFDISIREKPLDITDMDLAFKDDLRIRQLIADLDSMGCVDIADRVSIKARQARLIK